MTQDSFSCMSSRPKKSWSNLLPNLLLDLLLLLLCRCCLFWRFFSLQPHTSREIDMPWQHGHQTMPFVSLSPDQDQSWHQWPLQSCLFLTGSEGREYQRNILQWMEMSEVCSDRNRESERRVLEEWLWWAGRFCWCRSLCWNACWSVVGFSLAGSGCLRENRPKLKY